MNKIELLKELKTISELYCDNDYFSIDIRDDEACYALNYYDKVSKNMLTDIFSNAYDYAIKEIINYRLEETIIYVNLIDSENNFVKKIYSRYI